MKYVQLGHGAWLPLHAWILARERVPFRTITEK